LMFNCNILKLFDVGDHVVVISKVINELPKQSINDVFPSLPPPLPLFYHSRECKVPSSPLTDKLDLRKESLLPSVLITADKGGLMGVIGYYIDAVSFHPSMASLVVKHTLRSRKMLANHNTNPNAVTITTPNTSNKSHHIRIHILPMEQIGIVDSFDGDDNNDGPQIQFTYFGTHPAVEIPFCNAVLDCCAVCAAVVVVGVAAATATVVVVVVVVGVVVVATVAAAVVVVGGVGCVVGAGSAADTAGFVSTAVTAAVAARVASC